MYKIDLHVHTKYSSGCSCMDAESIVSDYLAAGYSGIVIADHYAPREIRNYQTALPPLERFLEGYYKVHEEGRKQGLRVYKGAEVNFGDGNDYLVFGWDDPLLEDPEAVFAMGLERFSKHCRAAGALLIQAHPFRHVCTPADHRFLDGVEVLNMHPWWDSHNRDALAFAQKWPALLQTSGSDCHHPSHVGRGGIETAILPANEKELLTLLISGDYTLIGNFES
jgi:predicted metal-dependent phosphoesterase TrpH